MPALVDPSDPGLALQWPLPPQRPVHPGDGQEPGAASTDRRLRLGVMASGNGSNFEALVGAVQQVQEKTIDGGVLAAAVVK